MTYFLSAIHHLFWGSVAFLCAAKLQNGLLNVAAAILGVEEPHIVDGDRNSDRAVVFKTHSNGNGDNARADDPTGPHANGLDV